MGEKITFRFQVVYLYICLNDDILANVITHIFFWVKIGL
jgi:hypothetical protein